MSQADDQVIYARHRTLRDLGNEEPGVSLPREETEDLDLIERLGDQQVFMTMYDSGRVVLDLQLEE